MTAWYDLLKLFMLAAVVKALAGSNSHSKQVHRAVTMRKNAPEADDDLMLWQREASERAVEAYAAAQTKKWRRWNQRMFREGL